MNDRDIDIIRHILQHCSDIYDAMSRFGKERASYISRSAVQERQRVLVTTIRTKHTT